ncbi:hypothetical protein SAMN02745219_00923 [Desulfofundulus thermosubterraneus DSM 16057]|uniref:Uncharacterized protein n=1 Tax=Desulfofundulus thermosubterraneus DSM 16057 TaxID=1121432 RepID=A0A1M6DIS1_9FIRM|nr:hypothetical protein SAMN02745219_00923 [Desulfofundulus thermosubterraneus DSM 16057]
MQANKKGQVLACPRPYFQTLIKRALMKDGSRTKYTRKTTHPFTLLVLNIVCAAGRNVTVLEIKFLLLTGRSKSLYIFGLIDRKPVRLTAGTGKPVGNPLHNQVAVSVDVAF